MDLERQEYLATEWRMFADDTARSQASLEAAAQAVSSVLDIGCGAGQEMLPFVHQGAFGCGVDLTPDVGKYGRDQFAGKGLGACVAFARCTAEYLPFQPRSFDVVICRLALPYTDNAKALAEMARVLRPDGILLLKIHHAGYYLHKFWTGLKSANLPFMINSVRVLTSGLLYHATGRQVRNRLVTNETFQTRWLLERELAKSSLSIVRLMPDSNWMTPSFVIARTRG